MATITMKTMTHTPGPWQYRNGDVLNPDRPFGIVKPLSREACIEIDGDDEAYGERTEIIAEVCDVETAEADARLMAAAPELLASLRAIRDQLMTLDDDDNGHPVCGGWRNMDATDVDSLISNSVRLAVDAIAKAEGRSK